MHGSGSSASPRESRPLLEARAASPGRPSAESFSDWPLDQRTVHREMFIRHVPPRPFQHPLKKRLGDLLVQQTLPILAVHRVIVGIELGCASLRQRVSTLALSVARWVNHSTMTTFSEAPL